jgi:hypothetical protein
MPDFEDYCRCPGCGTCGAHHNVKRLRAENEALRQDAERYRWVREHGTPLNLDLWRGGWPRLRSRVEIEYAYATFDAAIDAALKSKP